MQNKRPAIDTKGWGEAGRDGFISNKFSEPSRFSLGGWCLSVTVLVRHSVLPYVSRSFGKLHEFITHNLMKGKVNQKWKYSYCLLTLMPMESQVKLRRPQVIIKLHSKTASEHSHWS